ncbi:hypothetical protein [Paenibacillus pini]|uniref:Uncharacterized protein n=1 Tax=Paenibacillus pini JCM 16418 TaxID=1236976 RepID=W7YL40_9BACL|nr:hypothetical protein [Paenibacillus pini]GAF08453.1 hypothetical protein JCM16418_2529 [Paenibacillus pini JCM 16418]
MQDQRELYIRMIMDLSEEHGLMYERRVLEHMPEHELIELRDTLRMKHEQHDFKRYC